jgi:hypothetical protein
LSAVMDLFQRPTDRLTNSPTVNARIWSLGCLAKFIKHRTTAIGQLTFFVTV